MYDSAPTDTKVDNFDMRAKIIMVESTHVVISFALVIWDVKSILLERFTYLINLLLGVIGIQVVWEHV